MPEFKEGNEYYKIRSKHGRDKIFKNPEELANACNEYFEWVLNNPLKEQLAYHSQGLITKTDVNKMRPFTLEGLCNFLDIALNTFKNYEKDPDFLTVCTRARQIIDNQQYEGAASGFLNPAIVARKLGLADKTESTHTFPGIKPPEWVK